VPKTPRTKIMSRSIASRFWFGVRLMYVLPKKPHHPAGSMGELDSQHIDVKITSIIPSKLMAS
jgi:hypothetical protein